MNIFIERFMLGVGIFFIIYMLVYSSYLFLSVVIGARHLYRKNRLDKLHNELKHDFYVPISILVPAYNEEVTIVSNVNSLLGLEYKLYEIIVIDDGSTDSTAKEMIEAFDLKPVKRPIHIQLKCKPIKEIYESNINKVKITMIMKENGGKGDALNMGINASNYPYYVGIDADSTLQADSLEKIVQPVLEDDSIVAVGGLVRVAQCVNIEKGKVKDYHLPWNPILSVQVVEYDRSYLASKIFLNQFNGNLIISGAFGLFKKNIVIASGGYYTKTLGEDMELVLRLHTYCRNNDKKYRMHYEPNAICWSQAPSTLKDLMTQRRRWYIGLFQSMIKYKNIFLNLRFGTVSLVSYIYYLIYELLSPVVEIFGIFTIILAFNFGILNIPFMLQFLLIYGLFGAFLTMTAFFQRIYTQNLKINFTDIIIAVFMCLLENIFFRYILSFVRITALFGYKGEKSKWGTIKREKI